MFLYSYKGIVGIHFGIMQPPTLRPKNRSQSSWSWTVLRTSHMWEVLNADQGWIWTMWLGQIKTGGPLSRGFWTLCLGKCAKST